MIKIPKKHAGKLSIFLISVFMSLLMSSVVTLSNVGFGEGFFGQWMKGWGFAFMIGFPIISLVIPLVKKIIDVITE